MADVAFCCVVGWPWRLAGATDVILCVSTDGTTAAFPFLETGAVKDVLADNSQKTSGLVHAFEADGAGGKFD